MPSVAATEACSGFLPVANAFGDSVGMRNTFGIGRSARNANRWTSLIQWMFGVYLLRLVHSQDDFVRKPVGAEVHDDGEAERNHHALGTAEGLADQHQNRAQGGQEDARFHVAAHIGSL
jgi:hypothetical protein